MHENKASANSAAEGISCCCCCCCWWLWWCLALLPPGLGWAATAAAPPQCALYIFVMMVTRILTRFIGADSSFNALTWPAGEFVAATRMPPMLVSVCVPLSLCVCLLFVAVFGIRFMLIKCNFICHKSGKARARACPQSQSLPQSSFPIYSVSSVSSVAVGGGNNKQQNILHVIQLAMKSARECVLKDSRPWVPRQ